VSENFFEMNPVVSAGLGSDDVAPATLAGRSLQTLLDELAAASPAPGGGCAAAWACALAASLVQMSATFTIRRPEHGGLRQRMAEIEARAGALRERATELGERELHAYGPVLVALRLPEEDPDRAREIEAALSEAAEAPLALTRVGAEVATLALEAAQTGTARLRGDAIAAVLLAEGACQAAARLVAINLAGRPGDDRLAELAHLTERAAAIRAAVLD
jgi:methenyltetrahydrofolate cyclohydrolase